MWVRFRETGEVCTLVLFIILKLVTWPTTNQSSGIVSPDRYFKQRNAHFSIYCALKRAISSPELFVGHVQL